MLDKFKDLIKLIETGASDQAKQMGLVYAKFGRWKDPKTGKVTHKTAGERLVKIDAANATKNDEPAKIADLIPKKPELASEPKPSEPEQPEEKLIPILSYHDAYVKSQEYAFNEKLLPELDVNEIKAIKSYVEWPYANRVARGTWKTQSDVPLPVKRDRYGSPTYSYRQQRNTFERAKEQAEILKSVFEKKAKTIDEPVQLYRGVIPSNLKSGGKSIDIDNLQVGQVMHDAGFASTSAGPKAAIHFSEYGLGGGMKQTGGILLKINVKPGQKVLPIGAFAEKYMKLNYDSRESLSEQSEVLLAPDSNFRIDKIDTDPETGIKVLTVMSLRQ